MVLTVVKVAGGKVFSLVGHLIKLKLKVKVDKVDLDILHINQMD